LVTELKEACKRLRMREIERELKRIWDGLYTSSSSFSLFHKYSDPSFTILYMTIYTVILSMKSSRLETMCPKNIENLQID
jgi:hypothetical protein